MGFFAYVIKYFSTKSYNWIVTITFVFRGSHGFHKLHIWSLKLPSMFQKKRGKKVFFENDETTVIIWKQQWKYLLDGISIKNMILGFSIKNYRCNGCFEASILIASKIPILSSFEGMCNHLRVSRGRI